MVLPFAPVHRVLQVKNEINNMNVVASEDFYEKVLISCCFLAGYLHERTVA